MSRTDKKVGNIVIRMTYLTVEEEEEIDKNNNIVLTREEKQYHIDKNNIKGYGDIDLSNDSEDHNILKAQHWIDVSRFPGVIIPVYDYNTGLMKTRNEIVQRTETWNCFDLVKYGHCCLGKPNKIIIFKQTSKGKKDHD